MCGINCFQQRIDSGGAQGAGLTLARGLNTVKVDVYATDTTDKLTNVCGLAIINYESDIGSGGPGQNTHYVYKRLLDYSQTGAVFRENTGFAFTIPETNYWIVSAGFKYFMYVATAGMGLAFNVQTLTGEDGGNDYKVLYSDNYRSDAEIACTYSYVNQSGVFKRFAQDPDTSRLDIETSRYYQWYMTTAGIIGIVALANYHSFTYSIAGTVSNYTGDGSGITVDAFRSDNDELIGTATTAIGGTFSIPWYDNTIACYTVARQSSVLLGRSDNDFAV
jgi:hypothetical protein